MSARPTRSTEESEETDVMFAVHCQVHGSRVLLDWSRVESMRNTPDGPVIDWHCWCGARGSLIAGDQSEPRAVEPLVLARSASTDTSAVAS